MACFVALPDELLRRVHAFLMPPVGEGVDFCALDDRGAAFRCAHRHAHAATQEARRARLRCTRCCSLHSLVHAPLQLQGSETYTLAGVHVQGKKDGFDPQRFCLWHDYCLPPPRVLQHAADNRWCPPRRATSADRRRRTRGNGALFSWTPLPASFTANDFVEPPNADEQLRVLREIVRALRTSSRLRCEFTSWVQLSYFSDLLRVVGIHIKDHSVHVTRTPERQIRVHWVPYTTSETS